MNKQLINKYKPEFDHWLNGGKVLYKLFNSGEWISLEPWDYSTDYITTIIINDEFVEFRKALAEGKIIQIYDVIEQHVSDQSLDVYGWRDFKSFTASSPFSKIPDLYRIKPDEPKFKVGDFVTPLNREINYSIWQIDNILSCNTLVSGNTMLDPRTVQLWMPVKGEWCWFYDSKSSKSAALAKFNEMWKNKFRSASWNFCEPFLNSIPSYLKNK